MVDWLVWVCFLAFFWLVLVGCGLVGFCCWFLGGFFGCVWWVFGLVFLVKNKQEWMEASDTNEASVNLVAYHGCPKTCIYIFFIM